jgi:hypothetical protein
MRRREFIAFVGSTAAAWPLAARAQQPERMRRVGVLMGYAETDPSAQAQVEALRQELQKLGWEEGRNILIDVRFPAADADRVRAILTELMSLTPDLLVTNTNLVTAVVQAEVRTIPIVFIINRDLIVALATRLRLPALYPFAFYAKAGGLISYSFDPRTSFGRGQNMSTEYCAVPNLPTFRCNTRRSISSSSILRPPRR